MVVTVHVDKQRIEEIQKELGAMEKKAPNAISRAMNRTVTALASEANRQIKGKYHIKPADIKPAIKRKRSSPSNLVAGIDVRGGPLGLDKFKVSPKTVNPRRKSQLKISVRKDRGVSTVGGAFNVQLHGHKVMKRKGKSRLPIERLYGPSVPQMAKNEEIRTAILQKGGQRFEERLAHEIGRLMRSGK